LSDFLSIRFRLLVGIGGGVPDEEEDGNDIRLGDVVVSKPPASFGGVVQYDLGKYSTSGVLNELEWWLSLLHSYGRVWSQPNGTLSARRSTEGLGKGQT